MPSFLVNIDVPDLAGAITFYTQAFGLRVGRRLGSGVVELLGAGVPVYLLEKEPGTSARPSTTPARSYGRHWTPVHLDFVVDDLDAALARAVAAGARSEGEVTSHAWGRLALLADPFGHGFCFVEFTAAGYDAIAVPADDHAS